MYTFDVNTSFLRMLIAAPLFDIRLSFRSSLILVFRPVSFPDIRYIRFHVSLVVKNDK